MKRHVQLVAAAAVLLFVAAWYGRDRRRARLTWDDMPRLVSDHATSLIVRPSEYQGDVRDLRATRHVAPKQMPPVREP